MARKPPDTFRIPGWILRDAARTFSLTPAEMLVLTTFASHLGSGVGFVTDARMGDWTGLSRPTIQRARARLVKLQLIFPEGQRAKGKATRYSISSRMPRPPQLLAMPDRHAERADDGSWMVSDEGLEPPVTA